MLNTWVRCFLHLSKQKHLYLCCHSYYDTIKHIFLDSIYVKQLCNPLRLFLKNDISLPILTSQTIFGFINGIESIASKIRNNMLLMFKLHFCKSREVGTLELGRLMNEKNKVKLLIKKSAQNDVAKLRRYNNKLEKAHKTIKI